MERWRGIEMFGDGRLRVPSTSSLAAAGTSTQKRDPSSIHRDFLKNSASLGQLEPPTVASNEATGAGAVSPGISF